jgi:hypothetical protein
MSIDSNDFSHLFDIEWPSRIYKPLEDSEGISTVFLINIVHYISIGVIQGFRYRL